VKQNQLPDRDTKNCNIKDNCTWRFTVKNYYDLQ